MNTILGVVMGGVIGCVLSLVGGTPVLPGLLGVFCFGGMVVGGCIGGGMFKPYTPPASPTAHQQPQATNVGPERVGIILATTLDHLTLEMMPAEQRQSADDMKMPLDVYYYEYLALCLFFIDLAIVSALRSPQMEAVRQGLYDTIRGYSDVNKSVNLQMIIQTVGEDYLVAANQLFKQSAGAVGNPIAWAFGNRLVQRGGQEHWAQAMAATMAVQSALIFYHTAVQAFKETGLAAA